MSNNEFSDVIKGKLLEAQNKIDKENMALLSPQYHAERVSSYLRDTVGNIDPSSDPASVIEELMEILNAVPATVGRGFSEKLQVIASCKQEKRVWGSVATEWSASLAKEEASTERAEQISELVQAGEIKEATGNFERRTVGEHPGPSTRQIRKAKAQLRQSDS